MYDLIILNADLHTRTGRYSKLNLACARFNRETEGGKTFRVSATRLWNQLLINLKKEATTVASFRETFHRYFLTNYDEVEHFNPNAIQPDSSASGIFYFIQYLAYILTDLLISFIILECILILIMVLQDRGPPVGQLNYSCALPSLNKAVVNIMYYLPKVKSIFEESSHCRLDPVLSPPDSEKFTNLFIFQR